MTQFMKTIFSSITFIFLTLLHSCSLTPTPSHNEIIENSLPELKIPPIWVSDSNTGETLAGWLKEFDDKQLENLVLEALLNNPMLQGANAKLKRAAAEATLAGAALSPQLALGGTGSSRSFDGITNSINNRGAGLTASWEIDVWGRLRNQSSGAKESYEGAKLDFEFAKQSLVAAVSKAWFLNTELEQQKSILQNKLGIQTEALRILNARLKTGTLGAHSILLAEADLLSTTEELAKAKNASRQAARALEELLGRYPSAEIKAAKELPSLPTTIPAGLPSSLLERRPDTQAAERKVRAAFRNVEAKKLAKFPQIELTASAGITSGLANLLGSGAFFGTASNFFMPILDGGRIDSEINIANAEQGSALAEYGATALTAFREVENSLEMEQLLSSQSKMIESEISRLKEVIRIKTLEEKAGRSDILDVLSFSIKLNSLKSKLISIRSSHCSERINLYMLLGGGFS